MISPPARVPESKFAAPVGADEGRDDTRHAALEDGPLLSLRIRQRTIVENLRYALDAGSLILRPNGRLQKADPLPNDDKATRFVPLMRHAGDFRQPCEFLNDFLFDHAYAKSTVPFNCRNCYKVKVTTATLRQTWAMGRLAKAQQQSSKTGLDAGGGPSSGTYTTLFFTLGLDRARALYHELRTRVNDAPGLGSDVNIVIKRGCTNYEYECGPSDRYTFDPALEELEAYLKSRFGRRTVGRRDRARLKLRYAVYILEFFMKRLCRILGLRPRSTMLPSAVTYSPVED